MSPAAKESVAYDRALASTIGLFSLLLFILVGGAYFTAKVGSSSTERTKNTVRVNNLTQHVRVLRSELRGRHIEIAFGNGSDRSITAFIITSLLPNGDLFSVTEEFAYSESDTVIGPEGTYEKAFNIPSALNQQTDLLFTLRTVIFDDQTFEGDRHWAQKIAQERLGEKVQLTRIVHLLEKKLQLSDVDLQASFSRDWREEIEKALDTSGSDFKNEVKRSSRELARRGIVDDKISEELERGTKTAGEAILRNLQGLQEKQPNDGLRQKLTSVSEQYQKIIKRI